MGWNSRTDAAVVLLPCLAILLTLCFNVGVFITNQVSMLPLFWLIVIFVLVIGLAVYILGRKSRGEK
jgi:uncharacterized membrane protein (DUF4010 family)